MAVYLQKKNNPKPWLISWGRKKAREVDAERAASGNPFLSRLYNFTDARLVWVRSFEYATYVEIHGLGGIAPVVFDITTNAGQTAQIGTTNRDITNVNISTTTDDDEINVVAVRATALGNRFTFSTTESTSITPLAQFRKYVALGLGRAATRLAGNTDCLFEAPAGLVALTGYQYQIVTLVPVYYDAANEKITLAYGQNHNLYSAAEIFPDEQYKMSLPSGQPAIGAQNIKQACAFMWTVPLADLFTPASTNNISETQTDIDAGAEMFTAWGSTTTIPAGTVPIAEGTFTVFTTTEIPIDAGVNTLRASITISGTVSDDNAASVSVTGNIQIKYGTDPYNDGVDLTRSGEMTSTDLRDHFDNGKYIATSATNNAVGLDYKEGGRYATGSDTTTSQNGDTSNISPGSYQGPAFHFSTITALYAFIYADYPFGFTFDERDTLGVGNLPLIYQYCEFAATLFEGVNVLMREETRHEGRIVTSKYEGNFPWFTRQDARHHNWTSVLVWKQFTWVDGVVVVNTLSPDATLSWTSVTPAPPGTPTTVEMTGVGSIDFSDLVSRDTTVNLGSSTLKSKTVVNPAVEDPDLTGTHTVLAAEKALLGDFGTPTYARFVQVDPVSGLAYTGDTPSGVPGSTGAIKDGLNTLVSYEGPQFRGNATFPFTGIEVLQTQEELWPGHVDIFIAAPNTRELAGTGAYVVDGHFAGTTITPGGVGYDSDSIISVSDIGLDIKPSGSRNNLITVRWVNAGGTDVHGLFMADVSTDYFSLQNAWIILANDSETSAANLQVARDLAVAELNVIYNNFASLDFILALTNGVFFGDFFPSKHHFYIVP